MHPPVSQSRLPAIMDTITTLGTCIPLYHKAGFLPSWTPSPHWGHASPCITKPASCHHGHHHHTGDMHPPVSQSRLPAIMDTITTQGACIPLYHKAGFLPSWTPSPHRGHASP